MLTNTEKQQQLEMILAEIESAKVSERTQETLRSILMADSNGGKLYKYRAVNKYSLDSIRSQSLFCSKASSFNDPFDCRIGVDFHSLVEAEYGRELEQIDKLLVKYLQFYRGSAMLSGFSDTEQRLFQEWRKSEKLNEALEIASSEDLDSEEKQGQYLLNHFGVILDIIRPIIADTGLRQSFSMIEEMLPKLIANMSPNGILKLSDEPFNFIEYAKANGIEDDTDEIGFIIALNWHLNLAPIERADEAGVTLSRLGDRLAKVLDDTFYIGCLCTDYKNRLMWSHYADSHRGFCIEYDFSQAPDKLLPLPVVYSNMRPKIPWEAVINKTAETMSAANRAFIMTLLTKDDAWEYEHEWRMIISSEMEQNLKMPPITCIYLGAQCSEENKTAIMEIAAEKSIPVKKMVIDRGEFALHAEAITGIE